ncbi:RraA family protein [Advenella mimigardefordensis]|uniref:Putative 4-hydroxy-4-methyl-2-oxoglutarate aldolase n=1 Tax=Advenella mimigardefordensis (strain DSM 17166 / LMG 22922 / DPN7) TaxID=1247726 RepID=W0PB12_ADVMD|nr:RraA family protein [Advenella mimigardefordensis]AHG64059.1 RraA-like protein [Advenella mimigardefordensis DPN7]
MKKHLFDFETLKKKLYTAVLSDVLDSMGYRNQAMLPFIRPLSEEYVIFGSARTGYFMNTFSVAPDENPYEHEIALIDDLKPDDVVVLGCDGPTTRIAPWGELLSTASQYRGATGCVTDGLVRDIRYIRKLNFPVFHGGIGPLDSQGRGKMMNYDMPIECAGVKVRRHDLVFGDADGVIVIPIEIAAEVIEKALEKVESENHTREELANGLLLQDVYEKYGVL